MKTLAVFTGGIGDTLLAGSAFAYLHEQGPLDLAGNLERLALIQAARACDDVYDLDRIEFHSIFGEPSSKLCEFLSNYDRLIVWMRDDGSIERAASDCDIASVEVYPGLPPEDWTRHASEYYVNCLGSSARREPRPPIRIPSREGEAPAEPLHDVLIHPGSGSPNKNWPMKDFLAVADALQSRGRKVAWMRGPAESSLRYPPAVNFLETASLSSLASELASARVYIGNDSGVTHVAAATGCQTLAVFGSTDPAVWAPRGANVCVVSGEPWPAPDRVAENAIAIIR